MVKKIFLIFLFGIFFLFIAINFRVQIAMSIIPILIDFTNPVAVNENITWPDGPESNSQSINDRKPNIILILADDLGFNDVFNYYLDFIWYYGYFLFPIFVFLAVIWFTSKLSTNSEVVAILSSGVSFRRYLHPFILTSIFIAILSLFSGMFIIPEKNKSFTIFQNKYLSKKNNNNSLKSVYKQISEDEFLYVSSYNKTRNQAYNFSIEKFNGNRLEEKILAGNIRWIEKDSLFRLTDYFKRTFKNQAEQIESKRIFDTVMNFKISDLEVINYQAKTLNFFELNRFIESERKSGSPLLNSHILEKNKRITIPISVIILTILAVAVASFKKRGGIGLNLALGISLAFVFVFFDKFFSVLVTESNLDPYLGAWIPNIIFAFVTAYIVKFSLK